MIPTMIVFGLALGRWWKTAIIAAAILWPALLLSGGVLEGSPGDQVGGLIGGSVLAVLNTAVGVARTRPSGWRSTAPWPSSEPSRPGSPLRADIGPGQPGTGDGSSFHQSCHPLAPMNFRSKKRDEEPSPCPGTRSSQSVRSQKRRFITWRARRARRW